MEYEIIKKEINDLVAMDQPKEKQKRIYRISRYVQCCIEFNQMQYLDVLYSSIVSIKNEKPNYYYIDSILDEYGPLVNKRNEFRDSFIKSSQYKYTFMGVFLSTYVVIFILIALSFLKPNIQIFGIELMLLNTGMFFGALGGTASIFTRMLKVDPHDDFNRSAVFFTALTKPILGVIYGIASLVFLKTGFLNIRIDVSNVFFVIGTVAFIAGASERFIEDIISRISKASA